jgi:hypothetical protein
VAGRGIFRWAGHGDGVRGLRVLREAGPFIEVWSGRWQAGQPASALLRYLTMQPPKREPPDNAQHVLPPGGSGEPS